MYNLELDRVIREIREKNARTVLIQLPDLLKPKANDIADAIEDQTSAKVLIWFSSCFGACDIPLGLEVLNIDLMVQFGHNRFIKEKEW